MARKDVPGFVRPAVPSLPSIDHHVVSPNIVYLRVGTTRAGALGAVTASMPLDLPHGTPAGRELD
jgi:hypothetical protein